MLAAIGQMNMVAILIYLLLLCVFLWILHLILDFLLPQFGLPAPVKTIVMAIIGLIALIFLLNKLGMLGGVI